NGRMNVLRRRDAVKRGVGGGELAAIQTSSGRSDREKTRRQDVIGVRLEAGTTGREPQAAALGAKVRQSNCEFLDARGRPCRASGRMPGFVGLTNPRRY